MVKVDWAALDDLASRWRGARITSRSFPAREHIRYRAQLEKDGGPRCECPSCTAARKAG